MSRRRRRCPGRAPSACSNLIPSVPHKRVHSRSSLMGNIGSHVNITSVLPTTSSENRSPASKHLFSGGQQPGQ